MYYFHPGRFGFIQSTKGHSVLKKWAYGTKPYGTAAVDYDDGGYTGYVPVIPRRYDYGREEREIHRDVDREIVLSGQLMEDAYDTARKSHNRDAALLRDATAAMINTETYADPRSVVASRRAARIAHSYPEQAHYTFAPQQPPPPPPRTVVVPRRLDKEVVVLVNPYRLRPASSYNARVLARVAMAGRVSLADYHPLPLLSPVTRTDLDREMELRSRAYHELDRPYAHPLYRPYLSMYPWSQYYRYRYPYFKSHGSTRVRVLASPLPQKRKKILRRKAALVGSRVDVVLPSGGKKRRPRSLYAQSVMREIKKQEIAKDDMPPLYAESTSTLKAHPRVPARKYKTIYY